jgi:hypothetical protein|nr:MAG TPA: hypothetical protein [Caudoviricetes sp.]DAQ08695.1 MAG TPA: hypothetical protein [Caudoviricetes sp.]
MFKDEVKLIHWLGKEVIAFFALFFVLPIIFILAVTGITLKILLGVSLAYITFFVFAKVSMFFFMKKTENEVLQQIEKENEVKYVIIK